MSKTNDQERVRPPSVTVPSGTQVTATKGATMGAEAPTDVQVLKNALVRCGDDKRSLRDRWFEVVRERDEARAELSDLGGRFYRLGKDRDKAKAQRDALRKALERITAEGCTRDGHADREHLQGIAREALAGMEGSE